MKLKLNTLILILSVLVVSACSSSRRTMVVEEGWELLGEEKVNFIRDKDEIVVKSRSLFTALKFSVENKEVNLDYLKIHFSNGDKLEPNLADAIAPDQTSRTVELGGQGRAIDKIEFKYRSVGKIFGSRANVLIFGKKYYRPDY